jgi:hypothetical protein
VGRDSARDVHEHDEGEGGDEQSREHSSTSPRREDPVEAEYEARKLGWFGRMQLLVT